MEDDLSKYDFTLFVPAEKENQNDSKDKNWVLTEELVENETPDEENSNETSEEKVKKEVKLDNKEGEKKPRATAGEHNTKNKSVLKMMTPAFHKTLSDMFAQRSGLNITKNTKIKNNQGERAGKELSIPFKVQDFRENKDPFYHLKMEMQAHKDLLKDYGQQQQVEKQQEDQQQPTQQLQPHRSLFNILQIQEISKNVNDTFANIDNAFNKEKAMLLLQSEMRSCQNKIAILQTYESTLQQQMNQLLRN